MENLFVYGKTVFGKYFIDRKDDTKRLCENFIHGINTIIISPRRWGKTSLVLNARGQISSGELKIVNMTIFSCRSEEDFYRIYAMEVIRQTSNNWEEWSEKRLSNEEILNLPWKIALENDIRIVVCIDEFQQVFDFPGSIPFQKKLVSIWQSQTPQVSYCLYGCKRYRMKEIFSKQSMPFYKFGDMMFLQKMTSEYWISYIQQRFRETGKSISSDLAAQICETAENHSAYVQQFAWLVWLRAVGIVTTSDFDEAFNDLLDQNSPLYCNYMEDLTSLQIRFLRAIADGIQDGFSRKEVIFKYDLVSSANISRIKKSLEQKELIDISPKVVTFNDPIFRFWFLKNIVVHVNG